MKTRTLVGLRLPQLFLLVVCGFTGGAHAQGVIDQSLQSPPHIPGKVYYYYGLAATLRPETGQEFTPSLSGLDFVDVNLLALSATNTGTFEIAIHQGSITVPILGLSAQEVRSGGTGGNNNTHFSFLSTVPLTPGDTYVLEVLQLAGDSGWAVEVPVSASVGGQPIDMNYPGGRLIYGGVPQATEDMIFQEGIVVPEPSLSFVSLVGLLVLGLVRKTSLQTRRAA